MTLNAYAASKRLAIFEELKSGQAPSEGEYDEVALADAKVLGEPQLGSTRYMPDAIFVEFIYPDPMTTSRIVTVKLNPPERIVHMPVPSWVVENIWQGDIAGTFHFESEAKRLFEDFERELSPTENLKWFGPQMAKRRE